MPNFHEDPATSSPRPRERPPHNSIGLQDLNDLMRRKQSRAASIQQTKDWPSLVGEKPDSPRPFADDASLINPGPRYSHTFLHPPSPKRDSYVNVGELPPGRPGHDDDSAQWRSRRRSANLEPSSRFGWWTLSLFLITVVMVTLTAIVSDGSSKSLWQDRFFTTSPSNAILILRIMTECCALLLGGLLVLVVEDLQWALASRPQGLGLLHFVGLDAGTGIWGLLRLLATADWHQKYSSLFRLLVICSIPLPGIILMGDIALEFVFFPQETYDVGAGIAEFNASYIFDINDSLVTALLVSMGSPTWPIRDTWNAVPLGSQHGRCTTPDGSWAPCDESHLLVGGVLAISPQKDDLSAHPESTAYVVPHTRSVQLEYGPVHDLDALYNNGSCYVIGSASAASYWCTGTGPEDELFFGSAYCPLAIQAQQACLEDTSWKSPLKIASSLFAYRRYATVSYSRLNFSILAVTDLTTPQRQVVKLQDYMLALSAVVPGFKPTNTNSNSTTQGDNSALANYAVTALPLNDNEVARRQSVQAVRKAMAVPFNYFHANSFTQPSIFELDGPRQGLSDDMYTKLSISLVSHQVVAGRTSQWLFGLLSGSLLALSAATMVTTMLVSGRRHERCGYPTLDFAAVCAVKGGIPGPPTPTSPQHEEHHNGGGGSGGGGGGDGGRVPQSGLYQSLKALGQKPAPFQVARKIKDERIMLGKY